MTQGKKIEDADPMVLDVLVSRARSSEDHESYCPVVKREHFRLGLVVTAAPGRAPVFRIEVLMRFFETMAQVKVVDLERGNRVVQELVSRGYTTDHQDGGWVICEKEVPVGDIKKECLAIQDLLS